MRSQVLYNKNKYIIGQNTLVNSH